MHMKLLAITALLPAALAFSNTAPVVSWSSHSSALLDALPPKFSLETLLSSADLCEHDAVVFVDQPELRASDLRSLPSNTHIARSLASAASSRQLPYVPTDAESNNNIPQLLAAAAARCSSQLVSYAPGYGAELAANVKHLLSLTFPPLDGLAQARKDALLKHGAFEASFRLVFVQFIDWLALDDILSTELARIAALFPHHLVIYTSSASLAPSKRSTPKPINLAAAADPSATGGILSKYQLLTPGLITGLLITFFVLVPILITGINALSSIQSPVRVDAPKGFDAVERKNQ
ncbi:hypothetical protein HMN09_01311800 [Mycena chlorophos]|uniref:Protein BIG1 n=1 Tax=Mycena chlorophos TaxID=658473 RepID=A0A8H6S1C6_MYCCL|nr:hypothetical protein HMN09_01311800 [Mycena chlorophos]